MPYISVELQNSFAPIALAVKETPPKNSGELNYVLTTVILAYLGDKGIRYATMNDIVGALDSAKAEFQRRVVNPYEAQKAYDVASQNGDPYDR